MKKLILLLSLIIVTSCSSSSSDDDSGNVNPNTAYFNPPVWIQGTWKETVTGATYTFTKDDIIYAIGGNRVSNKEQVLSLKESGSKDVSVIETINNNSYTADYKITRDVTTTFSFSKISETKIKSTGFLDGTYIKQ